MRESSKSHLRRRHEPIWQEVFRGSGIDIGSGDDPLCSKWYPGITTVRPFDLNDGDAQYLSKYVKEPMDFVHSSNCLEHMVDPRAALAEWWSILKPGGYLVFTVPDEDLYEQGEWPSQWNGDHQHSFTIWKAKSWSKASVNVAELISELPDCRVIRLHRADTGYDYEISGIDQTQLGAEAFIEVVLRKKPLWNPEPGTFKHSGARGDIIYSLPTIQALGGGKLYLVRESGAYLGRAMTEQELGWFRELFVGQCGITAVEEFDERTVQYNLDKFRSLTTRIGYNLPECHLVTFGTKTDLTLPWLDRSKFQPKRVAKIVISRSGRYAGPFRWQELYQWQKDCVFIGFPEEHDYFQRLTGLTVALYSPNSYVDICQVLLGSDMFIGNQSFVYSLAEALKVNRVQESSLKCPNCLPGSDNGSCALTQDIIRHFVLGEKEPDEVIRNTPFLFQVRNRFSGSAVPKPGKFQIPIYGRQAVACIVLGGKGRESEFESMLANMPSKEIVCLRAGAPSREISEAISGTTSELICLMESRVKLRGTWLLDMCGMITQEVGAVGQSINPLPIPHAQGIYLFTRRIFCECGSLPDSLGDRWIAFAKRLKESGYFIRQSRSCNITIGEA